MGASESKLVFKQGIFRLSEDQNINPNDPYWTGFWELPESVEDVFSLFSPADIRRTRDAALPNLETLLLAITSRLLALKNHPSFPDPELAPERDALNCIRVLTRVLPFVYESEQLADWEEKFFWAKRRRKSRPAQISNEVLFDNTNTESEDPVSEPKAEEYEETNGLGEELLDALVDLLFYSGFTIPRLPNAKAKVTYAIWHSGVGCKQSIGTNRDLDSNRCEVLRLLLTMMGQSMYSTSAVLPVQGVRSITYLATCPDKQIVLSVLCSLLNTSIKYNATSWRLPYEEMVWKDSKQSLVVYSLQVLLVILLYTIPEDGQVPAPKNFYRHFLGRLHRPEDFQFLADGMTRVLSQPMQASASYIPGSQKHVKWAPEMIMLFWEMLQCNKRFRSFILDSNRMHDFVILMLFYAIEHKLDVSRQGTVRMCVFVLQTMSVEPAFGRNLNKKFEAQETLPPSIRLNNFRGSYADFLVVSIHSLITMSQGRLDAIYLALLAIINNMAAYVQHLSVTASTRLMQLFATMSTPSFLLANESNHNLLQSLLESINTILEHQYSSNANLIYSVLRSRKRAEALRTFTLEGGQQELDRVARRQKESLDSSHIETSMSPTRNSMTASIPPSSRDSLNNPTREHTDDNPFAIGEDEDSEDEGIQPTPSQSTQSARDSRTASIASSSAEEAMPIQLRGMSEKARGKMPAAAGSFSRESSTTSLTRQVTFPSERSGFDPTPEWMESWLPELPLHTFLTLTKVLGPHMPSSTSTQSGSQSPSSDLSAFIQSLPDSVTEPQIATMLATPTPVRVHLFEWSTLSLGWYMSVLWSLIFTGEMHIAPAPSSTATSISNTVTGSASNGVGPIGVWNGTNVKLFQVSTEGKKEGPSLAQPRGAVDAVGTRLVDGVKGLNLGGLMGKVTGGAAVPGRLPSTTSESPSGPTVREV